MTIYKVQLAAKPVHDIDESDLITLAEAARLRGVRVQIITGMLNSGTLPWLQRANVVDAGATRFTLRSAVEALPARRERGTK